jgi:hypothetical protein
MMCVAIVNHPFAHAKAKDCLERDKQWFGKRKGQLPAAWLEELSAIQAEADAVLAQPPGQGKK